MKSLCAVVLSLAALLDRAGAAETRPHSGWDEVPAILARIHPPQFSARDFIVTDFGATTESGDNTAAIARAVAACHAAGGGRVVVPRGIFRTGAIVLLSNVDLHVAEGATLQFLTDPAKYPLTFTRWEGEDCMNYSPFIYAYGQENIGLTGPGTLDGSASEENWWEWARRGQDRRTGATPDRDRLHSLDDREVPARERVFGPGHYLRPAFVQFYRCRNILIEGLTIHRSPFWEIHPVLSSNITVRGLTIASYGPNNDGCDPESCRDVLIENCDFATGDDCIAVKSGRNGDGRRINVPSENFIIRGCTMRDGHGGVVIGSEISGGCRNVFVENCRMDSPHLDRALRLKSNARRGGVIENIFMRQVEVGRVSEAVLTVDCQYEEGSDGPFPAVVRGIFLDHVTSRSSPRVMYLLGLKGSTVDDIRFSHCTFRGLDASEFMEYVGSVQWDDVTLEPKQRAFSLNTRIQPGREKP